jgi:hypothetical protein
MHCIDSHNCHLANLESKEQAKGVHGHSPTCINDHGVQQVTQPLAAYLFEEHRCIEDDSIDALHSKDQYGGQNMRDRLPSS